MPATTAPLDLSIWRNDAVYEFPLRVIGPNLTGVPLRAQIRMDGDSPTMLAGLELVTNGNAEGVRLASAALVDGRWVNDVRIRINKSTRQALPYSGELGDAWEGRWWFQIAGRTRITGKVSVPAHGIDSDAAPFDRPPAYGFSSSRASLPSAGATLTIAEDSVAELVIDGADLVAREADRAGGYADQSLQLLTQTGDVATAAVATIQGTANALFGTRGNWAPGVIYQPRDLVNYGGTVYYCVDGHAAGDAFGPDLAAGKWAIYQVAPDQALSFASATARVKPSVRGTGYNDHIGIQAALDMLALGGGGIFDLTEGVFDIGQTIRVPKSVWLRGASHGASVMRMANGANCNIFEINGTREAPATGVRISNLQIDGNRAHNTNGTDGSALAPLSIVDRYWTGVRMKWAQGCEVANVYIHHCAANGIQAEDSSENYFDGVRSDYNGFDGIFLVNQSRRNVITNGHFEGNDDIGVSCETAPYNDTDRTLPQDGGGADENIVMNCKLIRNGGPNGWSPRMVASGADYGLGALHSNRQIWIGNQILHNLGWGLYAGAGTSGHIALGNQSLFNEREDMALYATAMTALGNAYLTSVGVGNRMIATQPGQGVLSVQNTDIGGFSNVDFYSSLSELVGSIVYGNPEAGAFAGKFGLNAPAALSLFINAALQMEITAAGMTMGGNLGVGVPKPKSGLAAAGVPSFQSHAAALAALGPHHFYTLINETGTHITRA